jgi:hypothetical protein
MSAAKDGDTLSEIRHEYKAKKKQLEKYNTFIDRHQGLVVFLPLLLVLIGILILVGITSGSTGNNLAAKVIGISSLVLLVVAIVMAFITGSRKSAKGKIDRQLEALKQEATAFQTYAKERADITRDELGLWRDIGQNTNDSHSSKGGWIMLMILIVVIATVGSMTQANKRNQEAAERAKQMKIIEQQRTKQEQDAIEQRTLDQQDEANRLQQQKNAIDLYNSTKPSSNNDYRSSMHCSTSYYGGYTAYTTCD